MKKEMHPKVGIGVLVFNELGQILLGKRICSHGENSWGPPGGHLEYGETFEECAIREVKEETGIEISNPKFFAVTNDIFNTENKHYVSIFMCSTYKGKEELINNEPSKTEIWKWFYPHEIPEELFLPLKNLFHDKCYGKPDV